MYLAELLNQVFCESTRRLPPEYPVTLTHLTAPVNQIDTVIRNLMNRKQHHYCSDEREKLWPEIREKVKKMRRIFIVSWVQSSLCWMFSVWISLSLHLSALVPSSFFSSLSVMISFTGSSHHQHWLNITLITLKERHLVEVTVSDTESSYRLHLLYRRTNDTEHN